MITGPEYLRILQLDARDGKARAKTENWEERRRRRQPVVERPRPTRREAKINKLSAEIQIDEIERDGSSYVGEAAETAFRRWAQAKHGATVLRSGWPDFLLRNTKGEVFAVEVKSKRDALSAGQMACFEMLESVGVRVFVWGPHQPDKIERWTAYRRNNPRIR